MGESLFRREVAHAPRGFVKAREDYFRRERAGSFPMIPDD